ncbi:alpha/beta fold hydrolase [Bailinhaonella thermotolerans]|uniref:Alpha/beta hydrolase n=1 Tax=Bailinhaonella thermotolerans TaxID=1070861 RepID=A0A3A4A5C9_9ACTN|nr:alpha/beta hydrolase [Bailinhaonella thermotolerans]RJL23091.1 alpha/beta hydrolase [Bailinhaonella thermotolerans]
MTTKTGANDAAGPREPYGGAGRGEGNETMRHYTIQHDGVTIPVSRGGRGRPLVLCPGLNTTQDELGELAGLLRRDHDVVTFDLRGHGRAAAAGPYTFEAFLGDLTAVTGHLDLPEPPLLVGYSLGADLAVHHAARHPVAGLVLIDGANPVPEPFVTGDALPEFRAMWEDLARGREADRGTPRQVLLTGREILDLNLEIDAIRAGILCRYAEIDRPVTMIMSTSMAGNGRDGRAARFNRNWRAGVERLVRERPDVAVSWIDADHRLVFTHAPRIARLIQAAASAPPERASR